MLIILKLSKCCSANNISESLAESAAAYTKATARKCLLAKVEVITGEEAESNVLQVRAGGSSGAASLWGVVWVSSECTPPDSLQLSNPL